MRQAFLRLLRQTVTIQTRTGHDAYGEGTYGAGVTVPARIVGEHRLVRDATGREVVASLVIWVPGGMEVPPEAHVTFPDGVTRPILAVDSFPDETGTIHHYKIRC